MIGVDIIRVERVAKLAKESKAKKVFTEKEFNYARTKSSNKTYGEVCCPMDNTFAGLFCAKEAFLKALGIGIGDEFALNEVEVAHEVSGKPYIVITDKIKDYLKKQNLSVVNLTISHDGGMAVAVVEIS